MKTLFLLATIASLTIACSPSPSPIEYGSDMCEFCKMTIVDQQHAAELVTEKGKVYKFDAIECMIPFRNQSVEKYSFVLVNDFEQPGTLINAETSHFLISQNVPSPMGAFLTGFSNYASASKMAETKGGEIYNWPDIQIKISSDFSKL